jgi:N-acyl-D-aspartate/D-glutamate deacylase
VIGLSEHYDVLIKNSKIIDGTGKPAFGGSIGIDGERIVALGNIRGDADIEIDGAGLVTCPGFVDIHSHGDLTILQYPLAENFVMQGITTFIGGNCGASMAPIKDLWPWGIFTPSLVAGWWHEVEPHTYSPPGYLPLVKYREILEEKLGYSIDWRTFSEFLSKVEKLGISVNYAPIVGHNNVRLAVMGEDFKRKAKQAEIEDMKGHVDEAMSSGAFGLTTGLDGNAGDFASTDELVQLAKVAQKYGGIYLSHTRNFDNNWPSNNPDEWGYGICHNISPEEMGLAKYYGLTEAIEVCRKAKIPVQISHIPVVYTIYQYFPEILQEAATRATLQIVDEAKEEGLDVTFDVSPVDHDVHGVLLSQPSLIQIFSRWLIKCGSTERFVENLKFREFRDELKREIESGRMKIIMIHPKTDKFWMNRPYIVSCRNREYEGKTIGEIAIKNNRDPVDTIFDILVEDPNMKLNNTDPRWTETTIRIFLEYPFAMAGSDLYAVPFHGTKFVGMGGLAAGEPGPATYGLYPRYIRRFVREKAILSLEEAVKKITHLPAQRLGLKDRGIISLGAYADILVFDYERITDKGTALEPRQAPEGINHVLVNGKVVFENMNHTGLKAGKVLKQK